ncbi:MAG: protein phosphatase 2C domain-containing protein [Candidatus Azobacteroides sp.]|nr:protein phosphatase 2C domain-containing protein [Candidatus Azobacteroides sp.]
MQADETPQQNRLSWHFESLTGGRSENQDFYGHCETGDGSRLFVVCDGMGGMRGGSIASREAVRVILEEVSRSLETDPEILLTNALQKANATVFRLGQSKEELRGMGTTVAALLIGKEKATAAHVGDSRIYQLRGKRKVFRTFDHSVVFELVKQGTLTEEQARLSDDSNLISRALGMKPTVEPEITGNLPYLKGDRFMLCTDGISGAVEERELLKMAASKKTAEETVKYITAEIDTIGIKAGGEHDNLTLALIDVINTLQKPAMNKKSKLIIIILALLLLVSIGLNIYTYLCPKKQVKVELPKEKEQEKITP